MAYEEIHDRIQLTFADEGVVTGWALVVEVACPDGTKMLCHRSRDINGGPLEPWEEMALHHASAATAEQDLLAATRRRPRGDTGDEGPG